MMYLKPTLIILALVVIGYALLASQPAFADIKILNVPLPCDPALPPNNGGCGINEFILLVKGLIDFLQIIIIPLAGGFIAYGGFVILTAGGSEERVKQGKKIITAAVIGIVISLGAYIMITALNFIIGPEQFKFK